MAERRQRGTEIAIRLLLRLVECGGTRASGALVGDLGVPRASLARICRTLARHGVLDLSRRGLVRIGPLGVALARRRDASLRQEDGERVVPRPKPLRRAPGTSYGLSRHAQSVAVQDGWSFRRAPRYRIGFANAALDSPWRTALVHSVEYGAVKYRALISGLSVTHAEHRAERQIAGIEALLAAGADGLIVSAVEAARLAPVLADAERRGVPTVLVDRGLPETIPQVSFVTCDDEVIGRTTARWLAETLKGRGSILLLPGLAEAEPARRRLAGAEAVLADFPSIRVLETAWTGWQGSIGRRIMRDCIARYGDRIAGVWCDSGLQAVGSLQAFIAARKPAGAIPPHTGGDLNLAYKLAIRHGVPLAAVDYPPAMGLRAVEVLLDVLRGRSVPRRVDVPTEIVVTRHHATASVCPDLWADEHVRWDLPDDLILASGLGVSYDPRSFRIRYKGNRYNRSAARPIGQARGR